MLVGKGGHVTVRDNGSNTPYDLAIQCDFYVCAELLEELASEYIDRLIRDYLNCF